MIRLIPLGLCLLLFSACGDDDDRSASPTAVTLTEIAVVDLDMAVDGGERYPEVEGPVLEDGVTYRFDVQGTFSIWSPGYWDSGVCKGAPDDEPMFPSPDTENGKACLDAEFWFAIPFGTGLCTSDFPVPNHTSRVAVSLDGGLDFDHVEPIGGEPTEPSLDHSYRYEVVGQGLPVRMRREDSSTSDDYGVLRFTFYRVGS